MIGFLAGLTVEGAVSWLANTLEIFNTLVLIWLSLVERYKHKQALKEGEYLSEIGVSINTLRRIGDRIILHSRSAPERSLLSLVGGNTVAVETILRIVETLDANKDDCAVLRFASPLDASRIMQRVIGDISGICGYRYVQQAASGIFNEVEFVVALTCERRLRPEDPKRRIRVQLLRAADLELVNGQQSCLMWETEEDNGHYHRRSQTLRQLSELWKGWTAGEENAHCYGIARIMLAVE